MIYRAIISLATESMDWSEEDSAWIGYNPDTWTEHGVVETIEAKTLGELHEKLHRKYSLKDAEAFEGRLEMQFDGEHDYRTPVEERVPFREVYTITLEQVESKDLDAEVLLKK